MGEHYSQRERSDLVGDDARATLRFELIAFDPNHLARINNESDAVILFEIRIQNVD